MEFVKQFSIKGEFNVVVISPTRFYMCISVKIYVYISGDIFGPSLENLGDLVKMPYGCGEQNMVNFAPSVFAAQYMKLTGRIGNNTELQDKIRDVLTTGTVPCLCKIRFVKLL